MKTEIKHMEEKHLAVCAEILCDVYNNDEWQCRWSKERALACLNDLFGVNRFVGFVALREGEVIGGIFCRVKAWWQRDELDIEEVLVRPDCQRQGVGSCLIDAVRKYALDNSMAGITIMANRFGGVPQFFAKCGFDSSDDVTFMYKML